MESRDNRLEELLRDLVTELSNYNQPDQLDGYLNGLGNEYNERLESLGLTALELVPTED